MKKWTTIDLTLDELRKCFDILKGRLTKVKLNGKGQIRLEVWEDDEDEK